MNYFQPEQIAAIRDALKQEPLKWETLTHLFLLTGAWRTARGAAGPEMERR